MHIKESKDLLLEQKDGKRGHWLTSIERKCHHKDLTYNKMIKIP